MKVKMLHTIKAAYDHNHTREYIEGEVYEVDAMNEVGDALMPQWLADALLIGGYHEMEPVVHTTNQGVTHIEVKELPAAEKVK